MIEYYKINVSGGIPTSVASMAAVPLQGAEISSLRMMFSGGAPVPENLYADIRILTGIDLYCIYGMTETAGLISMATVGKPIAKGSAGFAGPDSGIRISGAAEAGESGEILVRSDSVFPGYLGSTESPVKEGWLYTGDLGHIDENSNLFITGRAKDLIIRSGHNIDPAMIEQCLERHPEVELAAAVGWPDEYAGELPVAYVQLREGSTVTAQQLKDFSDCHIDEQPASPKRIIILDSLPVTAVGKIHKPTLRELSVAAAIEELLGEMFDDLALRVEATLTDQGRFDVKAYTEREDASFTQACEKMSEVLGMSIDACTGSI
ncbi:AMP-binding protein [Bacterioplanoides sp.]|uniref:AMP-binding protein n=1 Tax=Bacterioplanoides sp. TaxID=2066072 RepID=UPI003B58CB72